MRHVLTGLLVLLSINAFGQQVPFKRLGTREGLSQSAVHAIVQDYKGFIWFGTEDGLNRFDGKNMVVYKNDPTRQKKNALSDRSINALYVHSDGSLWVGTVDGGLNRYNTVSNDFTQFLPDSLNTLSLSHHTVNAIARCDDEHVWVATENGLNRLNITSGKSVRFMGVDQGGVLPNAVVRCILPEGDVVWLGTFGGGLLRFEWKTGKVQQFIAPVDETIPTSRYGNRVRSIARDKEGRLWVGFDGAFVARLNQQTGEYVFYRSALTNPQSLSSSRITSIFTDRQGVLWIGTDRGLNRYDAIRDHFDVFYAVDEDPTTLSANYVLTLTEDRAGSLWVGTSGGGVSVFHRTLGKFNHFKYDKHSDFSLPGNVIFAIEEDHDGKIWVGTVGEGLAQLDYNNRKVRHFPAEINKTHNKILCVLRAKSGNMWFGTWGGGLGKFNPKTFAFSDPITTEGEEGLPSNTILDIAEDRLGNLWLATFKGLVYFNTQSSEMTVYDDEFEFKDFRGRKTTIGVSHINALALDNERNLLWLATEGAGVVMLNLNDLTIRQWVEGKDLATNSVYDIALVKGDNGIWAGTKTGLYRIIPDAGKVESWFESDGLQSDYILGVVPMSPNLLWLSSNKGLSRFSLNDDGKPVIRNYTEDDGLQGSEFNQGATLMTRKGMLYFGGINGINRFDPSNISDNPHKPNVVVTAFRISGENFPTDSAIWEKRFLELSWRQNFFEFEFASLDFVLPGKNLYTFMLEGYDEDWSVSSTRAFVSYTGLPPGDYTLLVKASNNDGVWCEEPLRIHIVIIPPFWKTTTFYVAVVIGALLLLFLIYRWRINKIKREKRILEMRVTERTHELAERTEELAEKNKDIMDSIHYAKRIQTAILPEHQVMSKELPEHFVLFLPKDVVSGDFYWVGHKGNRHIVAAIDCTGHGVPGAFMSMIGSNLLNQIVNEYGMNDPGEILTQLSKGVQYALKQGTDGHETNDGMDVSMVALSDDRKTLYFAGAYRPLYLIRKGELLKFEGDKFPIGGAHMDMNRRFTTQTIDLQSGDVFYLFTDGYADQFGGEKNKKFMARKFQDLLLTIATQPMKNQFDMLLSAHIDWKNDVEQNDDICVIGIRV